MDPQLAPVAEAPRSPAGEAFAVQLQGWQRRVELALEARLPRADVVPVHLHEALRYGVLNTGSRLRAALVFAAAQVAGAGSGEVDNAACAVELAHAGCLIHDALPPLGAARTPQDRRACHEVYDEATALLVGDSLLPLAIRILAAEPSAAADAAVRLKLVALLAEASGSSGMVGGQALQLAARDEPAEALEAADLQQRRTVALVRASVMMGAACAPGGDPRLPGALQRFASAIGPAVHLRDAAASGSAAALPQELVRGSHEAVDRALAPLGAAAAPLRHLADWVLASRA